MGELESAATLTSLIGNNGLAAILAVTIIAIVILSKKIFSMYENTKSNLEEQIKILSDEVAVLKKEIAANKDTYSMKLEGITTEMAETIKKNTEIIAQNNEIIRQFIQWREK